MTLKDWEAQVLAAPGAAERVAKIEDEMRLAAGLTALREQAGLSQREVAKLLGVSQPRIAAIERSRNVTVDVLEQYVAAVGGELVISVVTGVKATHLLGRPPAADSAGKATGRRTAVKQEPAARGVGRKPVRTRATAK